MPEIGKRIFTIAEEGADGLCFLVRQFEKLVEQAKLAMISSVEG